MRKTLLGLVISFLLGGFTPPVQAAFEDGHLIRMISIGSNEILTDLGEVGTLWSGSNNGVDLSQFTVTDYDDMKVAYFAVDRVTQSFYLSDDDGQLVNNPYMFFSLSGHAAYTSFIANQNANGGTTSIHNRNHPFSYYTKFNLMGTPGAEGTFGYMTYETGGGEASLGSMASGGYVEQYLMYFPEGNAAQQGIVVGNLATGYYNGKIITQMMDASGTFEKPFQSAPPVPVPAAAWVFGAGLLGLMVVRRFQ